jgi:hypothetical protein
MKINKLSQAYQFPGFKALTHIREKVNESGAVIVPLKRTYQKKDQNALIVAAGRPTGMTTKENWYGIFPVVSYVYILNLIYGVYRVGNAIW